MKLTANEKRVLAATDGRPMRVIAGELGMTLRNVKYHTESLRKKLGCEQRWMLIAKRDEVLGTYEKGEK